MNNAADFNQWEHLTGFHLSEAEEALKEAGVQYELQLTAPPGKAPGDGEPRVIAVRHLDKIVLIWARADWTVN